MEDKTAASSTDDQIESNNIVSNENKLNAPENDANNVSTVPCDSTNQFNKQNDRKISTIAEAITQPMENIVTDNLNVKSTKKKTVLLNAPIVETICDDITSTTENIKRLKHVQVRSNSTGKLYQSSRRVSFPENDSELVTGYLEPADPWACVKPATCVSELAEFYRDSCKRHNAQPIDSIMKHLDTLDLNTNSRRPVLSLREQNLTAESCEALEELLKRIQYKLIDLTDCGLNDASATALFDIIEYYEAANEIDISENRNITNRGWQACINMVKRSHALQILVTRGTPLSESNAVSLGKSMLSSSLNTLKLEHCGLSGRPMASLCTYLRKNTVLKELWLAHNDLSADDAYNIGNVLKSNFYLQFLDLSNNNIQDRGVLHIAEALIEQANYFKVLHGSNPISSQTFSSKHTLTRGDKIETKYECLARLINATKPNTDVDLKSVSTDNVTAINEKMIIPIDKTDDDAKSEKLSEEKHADVTNKSAKSDNNNITNEKCSTVGSAENASQPSLYELKIVEKVEKHVVEESKNDNDDDSSIELSNSATSLDSSEKNSEEANTTDNVEDNNNEAVDVKCNDEIHVLTTAEQSIKSKTTPATTATIAAATTTATTTTTPLTPEQPTATIQTKEDLTDDLNESVAQSPITTDDCKLDINENKSDMKLNYAEVVKVENALDGQLCENKNFNIGDENRRDYIDNKNSVGRGEGENDLVDKVQSTVNLDANKTDNKKYGIGCSSPKPIQTTLIRHDDQDDEMSPVCKVRLPLNSPRLTKSKDIMGDLPLTPDSSHSLDSSCEYSTSFDTIRTYNTVIVPERSFSSESLNSETSIESNDSKSSIKLAESKFSKNGTLERQINTNALAIPSISTPNGLQVLMLWNNRITRDSAQSISKLLSASTTLEILNVGKNVLSNDFIANIKGSLKTNSSLTSLGLQSVHLSNDGVKTLSEILDFGGNVTLQRVDLRDNNLQVNGLQSLNEVLKSNKSITRIDLDDVPRRVYEHSSDSSIDYNRVVNNIRSLCARNENPPDPEPIRTSVKRVRANFLNSRKISLTCQSIRNNAHDSPQAKAERLLDPARKSGRLRSPSPSPIPSPVSSPIPSPSRSSRFHVSRVVESNVSSPITPPSSNSCSPTSTSSSSRFRVTVVEPPKVMSAPVTIINNTHKETDKVVAKKDTTLPLPAPTQPPPPPSSSSSLPSQNLLQRTQSAPTTSMSTPSKDVSTIIQANTVQTKDVKEFSVSKPTEQHQHQQQHIATTLTVIESVGNSFDSPDLEVKGYMDDSCSSFSSLDSIDRGQDFNTSFSSVESYDILRENKFATDVNSKTKLHKPKPNLTVENQSNSSTEHLNQNQIDNSASSLEASTCSNDSIYGSQEFPVLKISSNEGTLTNSPVSPCSGDIATNDKDSLSPKPDDKPQRIRKTSWISRDTAVPATIDKLLSIFHHPGNLFFPRSNNGDVVKRDTQSQSPPQQQQQQQIPCTQTQIPSQIQAHDSKPPSRKESPSGLFAWTKKENVFGDTAEIKLSAADGAGQKIGKPPLQSNISPENTVTADSIGIEAIPLQLKQDVKENTSPEHTVTADSMANLQAKTVATQTLSAEISPKIEKTINDMKQQAAENEKVHFEVGGDDDDDEYDDNNKTEFAAISVNAPDETHQTQPVVNHVSKAFGLGQITRDSLSILKGSSNNSQDSMRSLESLSEIVFEES